MTILDIPAGFLEPQSRTADVESVDPVGGTLLMRAAPYNHEIRLAPDLFESFAPGTFSAARSAPHRVKLRNEHNGPVIGCAIEIHDRKDGVWIRSRFANTLAGQEARELARDGILDQVSVTFRPMEDWLKVDRKDDGVHIRHTRAHLLDVSMVAHGAYAEEAFVASVRDAETDRDAERRAAVDKARAELAERLKAYSH